MPFVPASMSCAHGVKLCASCRSRSWRSWQGWHAWYSLQYWSSWFWGEGGKRDIACIVVSVQSRDCNGRLLCSRSAQSKRHFCITRRLSYTGRKLSGISSRKHSVSERKQKGSKEKDTRSSSAILGKGSQGNRSGRRSLTSPPQTGFATRRRTGKFTTTMKERTIRCCRHENGREHVSRGCLVSACRLGRCRQEPPAETPPRAKDPLKDRSSSKCSRSSQSKLAFAPAGCT